MHQLVENIKVIWAAEPKDYSGAAMTAEYVSLKNYAHLTIVIQTGAWGGGTAAVTVNEATNVSADSAQALSFDYQWNDVATSGTLVKTAVTGDTFDLDTANKIYVIEIDASELDVVDGFDCVTLAVASPGVNADFYGVLYLLSGARFAQATPPSAIVD